MMEIRASGRSGWFDVFKYDEEVGWAFVQAFDNYVAARSFVNGEDAMPSSPFMEGERK